MKTLQNLADLSRTILVVLFTFCGCATNQRHADDLDAEFFASEKDKFVTVYLGGDVKAHGQRQIRRALSMQNIIEAAEGYAGLSRVKPKLVTIKRGTERFELRTSEIGRGKWKHFLINEGDRIIVNPDGL